MASAPSQLRIPPDASRIPPLENGDRLTCDEFIRRYRAMPESVRAELIEGIVYMSPPVSIGHSFYHADLMACLGFYSLHTPGVSVGDNGSVRLDPKNMPQPDAAMLIDQGDANELGQDLYLKRRPELIAEVAGTSATKDLHQKMELYRSYAVCEYIVWRFHDRVIDAFYLEAGLYKPLMPDGAVLQSRVFPGLWLNIQALLIRDKTAVLRTLQDGVGSPEHAEFVTRLKNAGSKPT